MDQDGALPNTLYYTETYNINSMLYHFENPSVDIIIGLLNSSRSLSPNDHIYMVIYFTIPLVIVPVS